MWNPKSYFFPFLILIRLLRRVRERRFSSMLGGMCTLLGTSTNLVIGSRYEEEHGSVVQHNGERGRGGCGFKPPRAGFLDLMFVFCSFFKRLSTAKYCTSRAWHIWISSDIEYRKICTYFSYNPNTCTTRVYFENARERLCTFKP